MSGIWESLIIAAPFSYLILGCCTAAFPVGLIAIGAAFRHKGAGIGLGVVTLLMGLAQYAAALGGYLLGRSRMEEALAYADPDQVEIMRAVGESEAQSVLMFGCVGTFGVLFGIAAIGIAVGKKRPEATS